MKTANSYQGYFYNHNLKLRNENLVSASKFITNI